MAARQAMMARMEKKLSPIWKNRIILRPLVSMALIKIKSRREELAIQPCRPYNWFYQSPTLIIAASGTSPGAS